MRFGAMVGSALLLGVAGAAAVLLMVKAGPWSLAGLLRWSPLFAPAALLAAAGLGWWYAGLAYARLRFRLDDEGLEIRRGVWWRRQSRIPRSRVQHTDIHSGPIDRRLGLATLQVYTAGTRMASVDLPGLPAARAVELRDALIDHHDDIL
jgi:uncharacterized protein